MWGNKRPHWRSPDSILSSERGWNRVVGTLVQDCSVATAYTQGHSLRQSLGHTPLRASSSSVEQERRPHQNGSQIEIHTGFPGSVPDRPPGRSRTPHDKQKDESDLNRHRPERLDHCWGSRTLSVDTVREHILVHHRRASFHHSLIHIDRSQWDRLQRTPHDSGW